MNFHEAVKLTENGIQVRRPVWGRECYLQSHLGRWWVFYRSQAGREIPLCEIELALDGKACDWQEFATEQIVELDDV